MEGTEKFSPVERPTPGTSCSSSSCSVADALTTGVGIDEEAVSPQDVAASLSAADLATIHNIGADSSRRRDILAALVPRTTTPGAGEKIASMLGVTYGSVLRSKPQHDAFLNALRLVQSAEVMHEIVTNVCHAITTDWPGPRAKPGSGSWFTNLSGLLSRVADDVRPSSYELTSLSAIALAKRSNSLVDVIVDRFAADNTPIVAMIATKPYALCLAQVLRLAASVDATTLMEPTSMRLNACFAEFTDVIEQVVADDIGVEVVKAMIDDLSRGLKVRRHVMEHLVRYSAHRIAKCAVIAVFEHSGKISKAIASTLLQPAPPDLLAQAQQNAEDLDPAAPTIVALACHAEGSAVALSVLQHLDGYFAVAMSFALRMWKHVLLHCAVPDAPDIARWSLDHPSFDNAVIGVHGKLNRDLIVMRPDIQQATAALRNIDAAIAVAAPIPPSHKVSAKICFQFISESGCPQGAKCSMLHIASHIVSLLFDRDCCWQHGEPVFQQQHSAITPFVDRPFAVVDSSNHSRRFELCGRQLSFTAGLAVYLARDYEVGLPIETEALCRQHQRGSCQKPQQCKYVHVCRKLFVSIQEAPAEASALPAPTTAEPAAIQSHMPCTPLMRKSETRRPFDTHVSVESRRVADGSCASTASGDALRARQRSTTASTGFSDLSESPIALAMSKRRSQQPVDVTPCAPRAMMTSWRLGPGHGTPSVNSTTDQSAITGRASRM